MKCLFFFSSNSDKKILGFVSSQECQWTTPGNGDAALHIRFRDESLVCMHSLLLFWEEVGIFDSQFICNFLYPADVVIVTQAV